MSPFRFRNYAYLQVVFTLDLGSHVLSSHSSIGDVIYIHLEQRSDTTVIVSYLVPRRDTEFALAAVVKWLWSDCNPCKRS